MSPNPISDKYFPSWKSEKSENIKTESQITTKYKNVYEVKLPFYKIRWIVCVDVGVGREFNDSLLIYAI